MLSGVQMSILTLQLTHTVTSEKMASAVKLYGLLLLNEADNVAGLLEIAYNVKASRRRKYPFRFVTSLDPYLIIVGALPEKVIAYAAYGNITVKAPIYKVIGGVKLTRCGYKHPNIIFCGLATVCFSTYKDNKFLTDDDRKALEDLRLVDEYTYEVYCLGKWGIVGKTVFDARAIQARLETIPKPIKTGYFDYAYDGLKITDIKWVNDKGGYIDLYVLPNQRNFTEFAIGGDTAGEGSDYFVADVIDAKTGDQVAKLRHQFDADQYTRQMYCLGKYYRDALIGIEANFDSYPIMELQRLGYPKQYTRTQQDTYTGKTEKRYGFKTTSLTRPTIISRLIEIVREHCETINSKETLEELLTIVRNEKGRIEAPLGGHDDQMMSLAIAHHIREQVVFPSDVIEVKPQHHFTVQQKEDFVYDFGEYITIV